MSTISVNTITDASGGNTAQINGATPTAYNTMGRNRIINGDMRIDQRNAGASVTLTSGGVFPVDRFNCYSNNDGVMTGQQDSSAPSGFINSLKITTTTADSSLGSTQYAEVQQNIEGLNTGDLNWGSSSAKTITLSFWVRSSLTGTFGGAIRNSASNRSYAFSYTISSANTWEYKTITIAGDTTGTWLINSGIGLKVCFGMGSGSTYTGTAGTWTGSALVQPTGATSVVGTLNATWYITGVQLEVGSVATEFERRQIGTELALCKRYFQRYTAQTSGNPNDTGIAMLSNWNTTSAYTALLFQQTMRAAPTFSFSSTSHFGVYSNGSSWVPDDLIASGTSVNSVEFRANRNTGSWTSGYSSWLRIGNSAGYIQLSAEL